ncbi:hypothetical protein QLQ12_09065 [Actinoplanes sp. NEAU-A12]|uniref:NACHT N-terminal Helical domain-containing protein n=1 Tax=Actinoplanes sandaracinus TaxID=3045177 RepID=A0ABT6WGD0_9ACTN|nr:hypothetical protein [Actinoplanes sandaracinus]MDI6098748.1 hypothetical protein [Actinoplanes sandaracinus]
MSKVVGYADAVELLGGGSPLVKALDRALGGLLLAATGGGSQLAISLFDSKAEAVRLGEWVITGLRDRTKGYGRYDRTQRLRAAHTIIAMAAFFGALDDIDLPFDVRSLALTADERRHITGVDPLVHRLAEAEAPIPVPHLDHARFRTDLRQWYGSIAGALLEFAEGLVVWEKLDQTRQRAALNAIRVDLPTAACRRYEDLHHRLAAEMPEFALWTAEQRQRAMGTALARMETVLDSFASGHGPSDVAATLIRAWRTTLDRPILSEGDVPADLVIPTLVEGYVDPDYRVRPIDTGSSPAEESWWAEAPERCDLAEFLVSHLTTPAATASPLLVLGLPGAGKSVLTRILAARLGARDFLPVRVVLRDVPAEAEIQNQIESAVRMATGETVTWPGLVRAAGLALPVVLLDGFDELLQATGVAQSDYLDRVAAFQRREAELGRPVAVLVTSRTAVADRAGAPAGTVAIRLEPFREPHVRRWLETWNTLNAVGLHRRGLAVLDADVVLRQPNLAGQPLLLMMLALYDADTNALRAAGANLDESSLYERLLTAFARREVTKMHVAATEAQLTNLVEVELLRLSVAAFGMFNRRRQWITASELDADLRALLPSALAEPSGGFRQPLNQAEKLVGRFFFMQRGQATRDGARLHTYEFLHATFGEYLIARLIMRMLTDLAEEEASAGASVFGPSGCRDGRLHALLSFSPLTNREPILAFIRELAARRFPDDARRLPITLFHRLDERTTDHDVREYQPVKAPAPDRHAAYDLNLVLLAVALNGTVRASELFPGAPDLALLWRRHALLWQATLSTTAWWAVVFTLQTRTAWDGERRDLVVVLDSETAPPPVEPYWLYRAHPGHPTRSMVSWQHTRWDGVARQSNLVRDRVNETLMHALEPLMGRIGDATTTFVTRDAETAYSIAAAVSRFHVAVLLGAGAEELLVVGEDAVHAVADGWAPLVDARVRARGIRLVHQLMPLVDGRVPDDVRNRWTGTLSSISFGAPAGGAG